MARLAQLGIFLGLMLAACGGGGGGPNGGGGGGGGGGNEEIDPGRVPDLGPSLFRVTPAFGTPADGTTWIEVEIRLVSLLGHPIHGVEVELEVSGQGNVLEPFPPTDIEGRARARLASHAGERKLLWARTESGGRRTEFGPLTSEFLRIPDHTYFVRTSGSDAQSGRSPREAWRNLDVALARLAPGDTLRIGAGTYPGPLSIQVDAHATTPFVLAGDPSGEWTGDPGAAVIDAGGAPWALELSEATNVVLQDLTLRGARIGLHLQDVAQTRVLGCELLENDSGLSVDGASDISIEDCRIHSNRLEGLRLENAQRVCVENNLVYANLGDGLVLLSPASDNSIRYNTFYRNAGSQIREEEPGGSGRLAENLLVEGGEDALTLASTSAYHPENNLVWGGNYEPLDPVGFVEADPLLADPFGADGILGGPGAADDDFRLQPESPAIDRGADTARDVWLASHESLALRSNRTDGLREHEGLDLASTNLGFHPPMGRPAWNPLDEGGARFVHANPERSELSTYAHARGSANLGAVLELPFEAEIVFLDARVSPLENYEELLAAQIHTGRQGRIVVRHWDGRRWSESSLSPARNGFDASGVEERRYDLEYEGLSGRALFVFVDGDGIPTYQILERGAWSAELQAGSEAVGEGNVRLLELIPRADSDEMALVTLDDRRDLVVRLWNGQEFGPARLLEPNTFFHPSWRPFDAAFESLSGDLLVAWGFDNLSEQTRWAAFERASERWVVGQHPSSEALGVQVQLASDPLSDRIAVTLGEGDADNDVTVSVWNGSQWIDTAELTRAGPIENRLHEVLWLGRSGTACVVFRRQGHTGSFNFALLQPTGWRIQPDVLLPGVGKAAKVRLVSLPDRRAALGYVLDVTGRLFGLSFDERGFTLLHGGQPLATGLDPALGGRSFDLAIRRAVSTSLLLQR